MKKSATIQLIGLVFGIGITAWFLFNHQSITESLPVPRPVVVDYREYIRAPKLDVALGIKADVRNEGSEGDIVFEATVYQNGQHWTQSQTLYAAANETVVADLLFKEVKLFGEVEYELRTYPASLKAAATVVTGIHASMESLKDRLKK